MSIPAIPDKPSFTAREVAQLTGFGYRVLLAHCRDGNIAHQRLGRQITFTRDQVIDLFDRTERPVGQRSSKPRPATPEQERVAASRDRALARIGREAHAA